MAILTQSIPERLVYETFGGRVYHRRGYRQVLAGTKTESEIMGCSVIQSLIVQALVFYLKTILPRGQYWVPTNEVGLHLGPNQNTASDIIISEKSRAGDPLSEQYSAVPPRFVLEVDIKIDPDTDANIGTEMDYLLEKSGQLLDFGVDGVAWILTRSRRVVVVRSHRLVEVFAWTEAVPLFDSYSFCLHQILEDEGILPAA